MGTVLHCTWPYFFLSTLVTFPLVISVLILGPTLVFFSLVSFPLVRTVLYLALL